MNELPPWWSEAGGLLIFLALVVLTAIVIHALRKPRLILEVREPWESGWHQSGHATRDRYTIERDAAWWKERGYETRIINLNDFNQEV